MVVEERLEQAGVDRKESWKEPSFCDVLQWCPHMYTCGGFILIFGKTNTVM